MPKVGVYVFAKIMLLLQICVATALFSALLYCRLGHIFQHFPPSCGGLLPMAFDLPWLMSRLCRNLKRMCQKIFCYCNIFASSITKRRKPDTNLQKNRRCGATTTTILLMSGLPIQVRASLVRPQ